MMLPPGVKFVPSEVEIIEYLAKKIRNEPIFDGIIFDFNVYGTEPWMLPNREFKYSVGSEAYYFSGRTVKGKRVVRKASGGTWKNSSSAKNIKNRQGEAVGHVAYLAYHKANQTECSSWVMEEYTLADPRVGNWCLCKVKLNATTEKKRKRGADHRGTILSAEEGSSCGCRTLHPESDAAAETTLHTRSNTAGSIVVNAPSESCDFGDGLLPCLLDGAPQSVVADDAMMNEFANTFCEELHRCDAPQSECNTVESRIASLLPSECPELW